MSAIDKKLSEIFDNPNPERRSMMDYIDMCILCETKIEEIVDFLSDNCEKEELLYGLSYLIYKLGQKPCNLEDKDDDSEIRLKNTPNNEPQTVTPNTEETFGQINPFDVVDHLDKLERYEGWHNFKKAMHTMVDNCLVEDNRRNAGLKPVFPKLHTVVTGCPGSGKTACISFMQQLYVYLGLLEEGKIETVSVSELVANNSSNVYGTIMGSVSDTQNGIYVIRNAHELHISSSKVFDVEPQIIRALTDALDNVKPHQHWMLVLEGEPEGMDALLSANPSLKKHFSNTIHLEDFTVEELCRLFKARCEEYDYSLSAKARKKLEIYFAYQYQRRGPNFDNIHMVNRLFETEVTPAFYKRLQTVLKPTKKQLKTIEAQDIPDVYDHSEAELRELAELVGLEKIKSRVNDYLNVVRLSKRRMEMGLSTTMPRLHMVFLGNPGTGKTTVAQIIGKVFASWGILSNGSVISTEKSKMVGQYIGETEMKMNQLLAQARGNVLFIDEAYQLAEGGEKDFGRVVMDSLLTELGKDNLDMVVILAGYTAPMKRLMESNEGIESRFPNVFNFEDYSADELVEIAKMMAKKQGFSLAKGVEEKISAIIQEEYEKPSARFGNARFVSNLLQNDILATMGKRTAALPNPTKKDLCLILPEDVIIGKKRKDVVFDDIAINAALARLDRMAGLDNVKKAIHGFVQSVRYLHSRGEDYVGKGLLSWRFVGNTGTGKSTVAEIMAEILKGMRLIANSHIVEIKGERILNVSDYDCDHVLREAVKTSCNGLIFIDVDTPECAESQQRYGRSIEFIRMKIKELTVEVGGECALIVAEMKGSAPNGDVAERLSDAGVYDYDHTLVFKDYTPGELFQILCICLQKHDVVFTPQAEAHMRKYLEKFTASGHANARTMKTMSRTIYRQVILRESGMEEIPDVHQVLLQDVGTFSWDSNKGKIGFKVTKK